MSAETKSNNPRIYQETLDALLLPYDPAPDNDDENPWFRPSNYGDPSCETCGGSGECFDCENTHPDPRFVNDPIAPSDDTREMTVVSLPEPESEDGE